MARLTARGKFIFEGARKFFARGVSYGPFAPNSRGKWQADLLALARRRLNALGVKDVSGGEWCTYADSTRFFSHRRDGEGGRMAALIWRE